jgi:glutamyl-tRNA reductase
MVSSTFKAISISYKKAPVEIREIIALDETIVKEILTEISDIISVEELLILSTCNRTEIYYSSKEDCADSLISFIGRKKGIKNIAAYKEYFEFFDSNSVTIEHLFRVSMGLEAQVIGDMQISNQIKRAYQWTADADLAGPFLHRLLHSIFYSSKRVAQETGFRDGGASVSYVTSELIQVLAENIIDPKILIIGLGEIGEDVCRHLSGTNLDVSVTNRTASKAELIALECGLKTIDFEMAHASIENTDIVVCAISNDEPFIKKEHLNDQSGGIKFLVDLSIPRSIEPTIGNLPGIEVYNIDDIQAKTSATLNKRLAAVPAVETIISESIEEFKSWSDEIVVSPTINKLKNALEEIRKQELKRHLKNATKSEEAFAEKLTKSITQKIIKLPVLQLKAACKRGEAETLIDVLNGLFDLEKQKQSK